MIEKRRTGGAVSRLHPGFRNRFMFLKKTYGWLRQSPATRYWRKLIMEILGRSELNIYESESRVRKIA